MIDVYIIRNPLGDGSATYDVRLYSPAGVVDIHAVSEAAAHSIKRALVGGANGFDVEVRA